LPHFEHAANVITVVNAQLGVIQSNIKVYKIIVTNKSSHILYGDTSS